jgi:hypothetical protein
MTASLVSCANTGTSPLDDSVTGPTVTDVYSSRQPHLPSGAPDLDDGCLADFPVRNNGFIRG